MPNPNKIDQIKRYLYKGIRRTYRHFWDHIIPHQGNNHHPHLLKHRVLFGYSVILILLKVLLIIAPIALPSSVLYSSAITVQNIIDLTNRARLNLGLTELKPNSALMIAAQNKADDMVLNQYFAHVSPTGQTPWNFILNSGYKYSLAGENLAVHFTSAESVQEGWMASPSHRANIVNDKFKEIGIGIAQGEFEGFPTTFVVQMFGTPQAQAAEPITKITAAIPEVTQDPTKIATTQPDVSGVSSESSIKQEVVSATPPLPPQISPGTAAIQQEEEKAVTPVIESSTVKILQHGNSYNLSVTVHQAKEVKATLGSQITSLTKQNQTDSWSGTITFDPALFNKNGELLSLLASSNDGTIIKQPLAWLAPEVTTQSFFTFNDEPTKYVRLFGFLTINNLDNSIRQFYFYFVLALAVALLLNILIKIRIQHISVISHTALVLTLALILTLI